MVDEEYWTIYEARNDDPNELFDYLDEEKPCKPYKVIKSKKQYGIGSIYLIKEYYVDRKIQIYHNEILKDQLSAERAYIDKLKERISQDQEEIRLAEERMLGLNG